MTDPGAGEDRPWEQPGTVRRDVEPHRAHWLRPFSVLAFLLCGGTLFCGVTGIVGLPLALAVRVLAGRDLANMRARTMDPSGRPEVERAWDLARGALLLGGFAQVLWGCFYALYLLARL